MNKNETAVIGLHLLRNVQGFDFYIINELVNRIFISLPKKDLILSNKKWKVTYTNGFGADFQNYLQKVRKRNKAKNK